MGKLRTKKEKQEAKHQFLYNWSLTSNQAHSRSGVNRQNKTLQKASTSPSSNTKSAVKFDQVNNPASEGSDILKSLVLASIIISFEVVLYFVWR